MTRIKQPMEAALGEAQLAGAAGEVPIGAVVVLDGSIIGRGHNRILQLADPTAHAEILAIRQACETIASERLVGCDLHVTLEPCTMCAGAISLARIRRLYYGAEDRKGGAIDHGPRFFASASCHHAPQVYSGIRAQEAADLLKEFFQQRR